MTLERELPPWRHLPEGISEGVALGTGLADGFDYYESPIGTVVVTFNLTGSGLGLAGDDWQTHFQKRTGRFAQSRGAAAWARHLPEAIEAGRPGRCPSTSARSPSRRRCSRSLPGSQRRGPPYAWLAKEAGRPSAVRAAAAVARNPIPLMIPATGGATDGDRQLLLGNPANKLALLDHEEPIRSGWRSWPAGIRFRPTFDEDLRHPTCRHIRRSKPENVVDLHGIETVGYQPREVPARRSGWEHGPERVPGRWVPRQPTEPPWRPRVNTIKGLAMDAVQKANSGHPGAPMGWPTSPSPCGPLPHGRPR